MFGTFSASIEGGQMQLSDSEKRTKEKLKVKFYGDIKLNGQLPTTADEVINIMKSVPTLVRENNDGKGAQLEFKLLPLCEVETVVLGSVTPVDRIVQSVDDAIIIKCEHKLDQLLADKQTFNDLDSLVKANANVLKKKDLDEFNAMRENIANKESSFLTHLRETLVQVRFKQKQATDIQFGQLEEICKDINDFMEKMNGVAEKLELINTMRTQFKIEFLSKQERVDNLILKSTGSLYMFFYDDELKAQQPEIYQKHIKFFIKRYEQSCQDADRDPPASKFVVVDMTLHPQAKDHEIKIVWYQNRELQSASLVKEESKKSDDATKTNKLESIKLVSGSGDHRIKIWNTDSGACLRSLTGHSDSVTSLQSLPNNLLASGSEDRSIRVWSIDSGDCIRTIMGHTGFVTSLQSLSNNRLASGSEDKTIKIWHVDSGQCIRTLIKHIDSVWSLISIGGNKLASGSEDETINIWNIDTGDCIRTLSGHSNTVWSLELLASNKLASGSGDKTVKIWNIDSGECIRTLTGQTDYVKTLQKLPNGLLASGSDDKTIRIWNSDNGQFVRALIGHTNSVWSLLLVSNDKLASGSEDSTIIIWNINSGESVKTLSGHTEAVCSLQLV